jgi:hypothetical protein
MQRYILGKRITVSPNEPCLSAGVPEINLTGYVAVYPNPASNFIKIVVGKNEGDVHYAIYNLLGSKVAESVFAGNTSIIGVSALSNGVYLLKIVDGSTITNSKFVIERN